MGNKLGVTTLPGLRIRGELRGEPGREQAIFLVTMLSIVAWSLVGLGGGPGSGSRGCEFGERNQASRIDGAFENWILLALKTRSRIPHHVRGAAAALGAAGTAFSKTTNV